MSELTKEELLEWLNSSFGQEDIFLRGLRYDHDISQESFDKRIEKNTQARKQIKEMIQKPGVTEEWIEERAKAHVCDLLDLRPKIVEMGDNKWVRRTKNFIRSLVEEISVA